MTINTKYARLLSFTKHYIFLLLLASLFLLVSCGGGSNPPASAPLSNLSIADATTLESAGVMKFTVSLSATSNNATSFYYRTKRGSANNKIAWQQAAAAWSVRQKHSSVVFNDKIWVLGGYDDNYKNDVYYSADGINWDPATTDAAWSARYAP